MSDPPNSREWNAAEYHRLSAPQFQWGQRVLGELRLRGDECLLDAGCGTGKLTRILLQNLPRGSVVGLDVSRNMVLHARKNLQPDFGDRVRFVAADLVALPFRNCFDGVFSTASFHWVLDHNALFRNLHGALRPGGWLHAQCGGGPNLARLRQRVRALSQTAELCKLVGEVSRAVVFLGRRRRGLPPSRRSIREGRDEHGGSQLQRGEQSGIPAVSAHIRASSAP